LSSTAVSSFPASKFKPGEVQTLANISNIMRIKITPDVKKTAFTAIYQGTGEDHGKKYKWKFYRHPKHGWMLEDYEGYERPLEKTWIDSLPVIQRILSNHGMTCPLS